MTDPNPAANLVQELAAEALELTAWILTPEDGYEPVDVPVPHLLRTVACRLQQARAGRGTALCRHVYEVASAAAALALAVRNAPDADQNHNLDVVNVLTRLESVPRAELPGALLAAAHACKNASPAEAAVPTNQHPDAASSRLPAKQAGTTTKHTCNGGEGPHFGRLTGGCPRCEELKAGAKPVRWQRTAPREPHHCTEACGPICTADDW